MDTLQDPLVVAFETRTLDPAGFHHREHLRVAWCYLCALPLEDALARFVRHLRALTVALGAGEKFHATITWAYLLLLDEAMQESPGLTFEGLLEQHPGLLDRALVARRFELEHPRARARFVLPRPA